ncbi:hypothetical protein QYM36_018631 [Artemia franciscana]|uniref:Uncharacterized protein n=1 Tax=Artemia franciscana TaxID=6661 RepID=A0AA88H6D5_ARTSF|nr:hypothetical protein QYM36_018631 [Artemia franciscana]
MVKQAKKLKQEKGIRAIPDPKKDAVKIEESCKYLIKMLVCNVENIECMLCQCDNCLSDDALIEYLTAKLSKDYDLEEEIIISQWVNTDRTEMVKQSISIEGFISLLSNSVENLIPHSYITKSQSKTFKKLKEDPPLNTAIVAMDFSVEGPSTSAAETLRESSNSSLSPKRQNLSEGVSSRTSTSLLEFDSSEVEIPALNTKQL